MNRRRSSAPPRGEIASSPARHLGYADVAIFESFVVPRYLGLFGDRLLSRLVATEDARVCHAYCRTGYPDSDLLERLPRAHIYGCDVSEHAVMLAKTKAVALTSKYTDALFEYRVVDDGSALPYEDGVFSHALTLHPLAVPVERSRVLGELVRVVARGGQVLVAMPLRGSFVELADLLRECALKNERPALSNAVEAAMQLRPTETGLKDELSAAGLGYVDTDVRTRTLRFSSGRDFFEDPTTRLLLLPEFRVNLGLPEGDDDGFDPFAYVREAIDKYWSDAPFELTVNVAVGSGRKL